MTREDQDRFPGQVVTLRDGRNVTLRWLTTSDGDGLARFYAGLPSQSLRHYWPHPLDDAHAHQVAAKAESPLEAVLVIETPDQDIGGYAWFRWTEPSATSSTFGICLRTDYQSSGAGRALMTHLLAVADAGIGPREMQLTCQHANVRAVELYQKLGFVITREGMVEARRGFAAEPQYWMLRDCGPR